MKDPSGSLGHNDSRTELGTGNQVREVDGMVEKVVNGCSEAVHQGVRA